MTLEQWLVFVAVWTLTGLPLGPNALNCIALSDGTALALSARRNAAARS